LANPPLGVTKRLTAPRGAAKRFDFPKKQGKISTAGTTYMLMPGAELIVDGGLRRKQQWASFFGTFADPASSDPSSRFEATLDTWSFTPRIKLDGNLGDVGWKAI